jgi:predicted nuclease of predicted toxin-antitoxin system
MRLLLDQDVYAVTARFLNGLGHDIVLAGEAGLSRATDLEVLNKAREDRRILVTRDRDFGGLVFTEVVEAGVIYLKIGPTTVKSVHEELRRALEEHSEDQVRRAFVVVEPGRHRFRRHRASRD